MTNDQSLKDLVLKPNLNQGMGKISLNVEMLRVLQAMDGKKDLGDITAELDISMGELKSIVKDLYLCKLVVKVKRVKKLQPVISRELVAFIQQTLAESMGPMAEVLLKDTVKTFGKTIETLPLEKAPDLVEKLSAKIMMEEKRLEFVQTVIARINRS